MQFTTSVIAAFAALSGLVAAAPGGGNSGVGDYWHKKNNDHGRHHKKNYKDSTFELTIKTFEEIEVSKSVKFFGYTEIEEIEIEEVFVEEIDLDFGNLEVNALKSSLEIPR